MIQLSPLIVISVLLFVLIIGVALGLLAGALLTRHVLTKNRLMMDEHNRIVTIPEVDRGEKEKESL